MSSELLDKMIERLGELPDATDPEVREKCEEIRNKVRGHCRWRRKAFPGSQPVSFCKSHLRDIVDKPYVACEKTDGVRFLLYASGGRVFLIDRTEKIRMLLMRLPASVTDDSHQKGTLLDGELVLDHKVPLKSLNEDAAHTATTQSEVLAAAAGEGCSNGNAENENEDPEQFKLRFLIFDAVAINNEMTVSELSLLDRLRKIFVAVIKPRLAWEARNPEAVAEEKRTNNHLEIYLKDFFEVLDIPAVMNFQTRLLHRSDGLIFTPVDLPYVAGTCMQLLKWKPPEENTVDFEAQVVEDRERNLKAVRLGMSDRGTRVLRGMFLGCYEDQEEEEFQQEVDLIEKMVLEGAVFLECKFDTNAITRKPTRDSNDKWSFERVETIQGGWICCRVRRDRETPNDVKVVKRVLQSLEDGITFPALVKHLSQASKTKSLSVSASCRMPKYYAEYGTRAVNPTAAAAQHKQLTNRTAKVTTSSSEGRRRPRAAAEDQFANGRVPYLAPPKKQKVVASSPS